MDYELTDEYLADARQRAYRYQGQWTGTAGSLAADVARLLLERKKMQGTITNLEDTNSQLRAAVETRLAGTSPSVADTDAAGGEYADAMRNTKGCCDGGKCHSPIDEAPERWKEITQASAAKYHSERAEPEETVPVDWILQGQKEMDVATDDIRWTGDSIIAKQDDIRPGSREFLEVLDELKQLHMRKTMDYGVDDDALSNIRSSADVVNMPAWAGCILRISDKMHRLKAFFRNGRCEFDGVEDTLKDIACYAAIALVLHRESGESDPVTIGT
jgi:hypothetical protein